MEVVMKLREQDSERDKIKNEQCEKKKQGNKKRERKGKHKRGVG